MHSQIYFYREILLPSHVAQRFGIYDVSSASAKQAGRANFNFLIFALSGVVEQHSKCGEARVPQDFFASKKSEERSVYAVLCDRDEVDIVSKTVSFFILKYSPVFLRRSTRCAKADLK